MKTRSFLLFLLIAGLLLNGCKSPFKTKSDKQAAIKPIASGTRSSSSPTRESSRVSTATPIGSTGQSITVHTGDIDGLYLGDEVVVPNLPSGKSIKEAVFGYPLYGSIKAYPNGHFRYYPPTRPCKDEIDVRVIADDGSQSKVKIKINVLPKGEILSYQEARAQRAAADVSRPTDDTATPTPMKKIKAFITIESPKDGYNNPKRVCKVSGSTNLPDNSTLNIYVLNSYGMEYLQDYHPKVQSGKYEGWVFLGDEYGHGIGEDFIIHVRDSTRRVISSKITIHRNS